ncbi:MAG TPA: porin family protein [Cyclobacteriaceae bacterium]|nr:porin family protein [Cyclobacteriaceae bacterium]
MKILKFLLVGLIISPLALSAQKFQVGPRIGPLLSFNNFGDNEARESFDTFIKPGFIAGVMVGFPLKDNFSFVVDANYAQKGRTLLFYERAWKNSVTHNHLEGSMLVRKAFDFEFSKGVPGKAFVNIGPNVSYLLGGSGSVSTVAVTQRYTIVFNELPTADFTKMYYNNFNRWMFGLDVGAGFSAPVSKDHQLLTELRFLFGHTYFGQEDSSYIDLLGFIDNMKANYRVISISLTYVIEQDLKNNRKGKSTLNRRLKKIQ